MKTLVHKANCYVPMGTVWFEPGEGGVGKNVDRPWLPVLKCRLVCQGVGIPAMALLDTGNDITIVSPKFVERLTHKMKQDAEGPFDGLDVWGRYEYAYADGRYRMEPAYQLGIGFGEDRFTYVSRYAFIAPENWIFDVADVWVGQDIFSQLVVTFDGPGRTVTIADPRR